ncbi:hypothetical protein E3N88_42386 [Mikania micrantha]|uniref:Uncharacterized protein n=1 Tax=Mikania micrantha TaxID=192012 RepID=A0A5N6LI27_9ASTR|nr:hypothetical protein E3N88_42386 [Mikania micrantha]
MQKPVKTVADDEVLAVDGRSKFLSFFSKLPRTPNGSRMQRIAPIMIPSGLKAWFQWFLVGMWPIKKLAAYRNEIRDPESPLLLRVPPSPSPRDLRVPR